MDETFSDKAKEVVIVGAGFGGLNAAKILGHVKDVHVTLIDGRNHHLFQPLLYQVATAGLSPADIAVPIRSELKPYRNVEVHLDHVEHVDLTRRVIYSRRSIFEYDYLILACGAKHSYFGHSQWEDFAPGLKTLEQATEIRSRILCAFEFAENTMDPAVQREYLTFVIVGGGPTGVELAGALAEISRQVLVKEFRRFDSRDARIILVEAGPTILPQFHSFAQKRALHDLRTLGVEVMTNSRVTSIDGSGIGFGDRHLRARTVVWAAGVEPSHLNRSLGVSLDRQGRVVVEPDLSVPGFTHTFVIGDQAHAKDRAGNPLPGLAPVAIQQGRFVAENIAREMVGRKRRTFRYHDKGQMATIGKRRAVAEVDSFRFGGWAAWVAWLMIHIYYLVGFRNRVSVFLQWAWSYLFSKRSARLIINKEWRFYHAQSSQESSSQGSQRMGPHFQ